MFTWKKVPKDIFYVNKLMIDWFHYINLPPTPQPPLPNLYYNWFLVLIINIFHINIFYLSLSLCPEDAFQIRKPETNQLEIEGTLNCFSRFRETYCQKLTNCQLIAIWQLGLSMIRIDIQKYLIRKNVLLNCKIYIDHHLHPLNVCWKFLYIA